jgi:hypothetical protein
MAATHQEEHKNSPKISTSLSVAPWVHTFLQAMSRDFLRNATESVQNEVRKLGDWPSCNLRLCSYDATGQLPVGFNKNFT